MFIYLTENLVNGKKYIGLCTRDDDSYLGSGKIIKHAIAKYGKQNFKRTILERCDTFEELFQAEQRWIEDLNAVDDDSFYNICYGGKGVNPKTVKKYWDSLDLDQRKERNQYMKKIDRSGEKNPMYGRSNSESIQELWDKRSDEERKKIGKKISESLRKNGSRVKEKNSMYGRSIVIEKNLRWYNNGERSIYVTEGTQPEGFIRGRGFKKLQSKD